MSLQRTTPRRISARMWAAALAWGLAVLASVIYVASSLIHHPPESDIRGLLPDAGTPQAEKALRAELARRHENTLTLFVSRPEAKDGKVRGGAPVDLQAEARKLAKVLDEAASKLEPALRRSAQADPGRIEAALREAAEAQMTLADEARFGAMSAEALGASALSAAASPVAGAVLDFSHDPQRFATRWVAERLATSPLTALYEDASGTVLARRQPDVLAVLFETGVAPVAERERLEAAVAELETTVRAAFPGMEVMVTGLPRFTLHAVGTAEREMTVLGGVSLAVIVLLGIWWFGNLRTLCAMVLVTLSSFAVAAAAVIGLTGGIHLIALVFGTTLIGITVDYGAHYFCQRLGRGEDAPWTQLKKLLPNLTLAFLSTALAFGTMALAPLPGLRQMAVFGAAGVAAAFAGVVLWLPVLDVRPIPFRERTRKVAVFLAKLPSVDDLQPAVRAGLVVALAVFVLWGASGLRLTTSLYELNNAPRQMLLDAGRAATLSAAPSISQYYLVTGRDEAERLAREEALERALYEKRGDPAFAGIGLASEADWFPSPARRAAVAAVKRDVCAKTNLTVEPMLGAPLACMEAASPDPADEARLKEALTPLLPPTVTTDMESASLVLLTGVTAKNVKAAASLGAGIEGVHWRDMPADITETLTLYRDLIAVLLGAGFLLIAVVLAVRFRKEAWRALGPTATASLLTLGLLGAMGESLSLFTVLAGVLLLGLGIDYGIFLTAEGEDERTLCAITFAALTTMASFGLLALSETPALRSFGLTVAFGETLIFFLTPWMRRRRGS